jgi:hypothetical protein
MATDPLPASSTLALMLTGGIVGLTVISLVKNVLPLVLVFMVTSLVVSR